ncbi:MAG: type II toxin-antitoxin system VapC family toxin [Ornithinimicrobium sp.]|jgi:toxin-antitoxin system PIN domain toxin|uniref:type II toxin-antitoxin system VapC family toxin n=1 Tax=Ornithinimicrobium sp. TaxID=1977084 RepID=UPI0017F74206|nr:PIN domain-containing protein [Actinomycetota bacterium]
MIAVDTNILVYAHRADGPHHDAATDALQSLTAAGAHWVVPWPCIHEFLAIVTHPKVFGPPTPVEQALHAAADLLALEGMRPAGESTDYFDVLRRVVLDSRVVGPKVHDARIAAICLAHGVSELWTADRDFSYFPRLQTRNPLIER